MRPQYLHAANSAYTASAVPAASTQLPRGNENLPAGTPSANADFAPKNAQNKIRHATPSRLNTGTMRPSKRFTNGGGGIENIPHKSHRERSIHKTSPNAKTKNKKREMLADFSNLKGREEREDFFHRK